MKRSLLSPAVASLVAAAMCLLLPLAANAQGRQPRGGKSTTDKYYVVKILNLPEDKNAGPAANGSAYDFSKEYMVLGTSELKSKQDGYDSEYKTKTVPEWEDERKNIDPEKPKPKKPTIKKLRTFNTREVADEYLKKLLDDLAKKEADKPAATDPASKTGPK